MESEESSFDDQFEEQKTNNIEKKGIENITLENFQARPDKIIELWAAKVTDQSAEIAWEIPDCNNSEITEYTIKTKELSKDTRSLTFQSVHRAVDNSVTIEDLLPETWYLIDVRAVNEYGYCPTSSKMLAVRTLPLEKGSLYAWGSNKNDELGLSEEDMKSPYFNKAKSVAMGPICVNAFKNFATDVSSSDAITLTTISSPTPLNLIQAGVTFDLEDDEPTIVHSKEEAFRQIFSLPFCQPIKNAKDIFEQVVKIECGMNFAVALTTSGKVYSWGISGSGQLGQENNPEKDSNNSSEITAVRRPLMIKDLNWDDDFVMDVAVGFTHCIALTYKRRVFIWGESCDFPHHKISDVSHDLYTSSALYPREIKTMIADYEPMQVFAGTLFSGILTTDGKLLTFGIGNSGQLGHLDKADSDGKEFGFLYIPKRVDALDDYFIENVSFGGCHVLVTARKKLMINETDFKIEGPCQTFAWGSNVQGQCACGADQQISLPKKLDVFDNKEVLQISAGIDHSLFLVQEEDGSTAVYSCGNAVDGACGVSKSLTGKFSSPKHIKTLDKKRKLTVKEGLGKVIKIKAGSKTSFAIIESE